MAKAIALTQISYNGIETTKAPIALNTSKIYSLESNGSGTKVFYKNQDGTVINTIDVLESANSILSNINASIGTGVTMLSLYDTNFNLLLIPASSFLMANELNDGGSIVTYTDNSSIANARVNNSVAGLVNIINGVTVGQYDSGQIIIDTSAGFAPNQYVSAVDNTYKNNAVGFYAASINDGLNKPSIIYFPNPTTNPSNPFYGYDAVVRFKPSIPWTSINKVTVYTNITNAGIAPDPFAFVIGYELGYYQPGTTIWNPEWTGGGGSGIPGTTPAYGFVNQLLPGVPPSTPYTPNAGDAGTYWGELNYSTGYPNQSIGGYSIGIGDIYYGQSTVNIPTPTLVDLWMSSMIGFIWKSKNSTPNLKFRFVIDYI